jgi:hypothetical protein
MCSSRRLILPGSLVRRRLEDALSVQRGRKLLLVKLGGNRAGGERSSSEERLPEDGFSTCTSMGGLLGQGCSSEVRRGLQGAGGDSLTAGTPQRWERSWVSYTW